MVKERTFLQTRSRQATPKTATDRLPPTLDRLGIWLVVLSAVGFGTLGIFGKLAYGQQMTMLQSLSWRLGGGAAGLWSWLLWCNQWRIPWRNAIAAFGLGAIVYAVQAGLFFTALTYATAGVTALMFYTYPAFVAIGTWTITRKPLPPLHLWALGITFCGCLVTIDWQQQQLHPWGLGLGVASGATYGLYLMLSARLLRQTPPIAAATYMLSGAAIVTLSLAISQQSFFIPHNFTQIGIVAGLAIVATALPIGLLFHGLSRISVVSAAILSTLEPIAAVGLGLLYLQEPLWPGQLVGGALILVAALLLQINFRPTR